MSLQLYKRKNVATLLVLVRLFYLVAPLILILSTNMGKSDAYVQFSYILEIQNTLVLPDSSTIRGVMIENI